MTPEPQRNDAPVSGVPLSVIIDTLRDCLKQSRTDLEQAKRERDADKQLLERLTETAQEAYAQRDRNATALADMTAQRDALAAEFNALRQRIAELEAALRQAKERLTIFISNGDISLGCDPILLVIDAALRDTAAPQQPAPDAQ